MDRPTLTSGELFYKLLAVRTQLSLHEAEVRLALTTAELSKTHLSKLTEGLPQLEAQALADLNAPTGSRFNWSTFSYDDPPAERETSPVES